MIQYWKWSHCLPNVNKSAPGCWSKGLSQIGRCLRERAMESRGHPCNKSKTRLHGAEVPNHGFQRHFLLENLDKKQESCVCLHPKWTFKQFPWLSGQLSKFKISLLSPYFGWTSWTGKTVAACICKNNGCTILASAVLSEQTECTNVCPSRPNSLWCFRVSLVFCANHECGSHSKRLYVSMCLCPSFSFTCGWQHVLNNKINPKIATPYSWAACWWENFNPTSLSLMQFVFLVSTFASHMSLNKRIWIQHDNSEYDLFDSYQKLFPLTKTWHWLP